VLKGDRGHEFFAGQIVPRSGEGNGSDDDGVKEDADEDGHPDGFEKTLAAELGSDSSAALLTDSNPVIK